MPGEARVVRRAGGRREQDPHGPEQRLKRGERQERAGGAPLLRLARLRVPARVTPCGAGPAVGGAEERAGGRSGDPGGGGEGAVYRGVALRRGGAAEEGHLGGAAEGLGGVGEEAEGAGAEDEGAERRVDAG